MRRFVALVLVVLASVLAVFGSLAVWLDRTLLNTDEWVTLSSDILAEQTVSDAVAVYLVNSLFERVDVEQQLSDRLPEVVKPLAGPAAGALRGAAEPAAKQALQSEPAQQLWENANRQAHAAFIRVIEGGGPVVSTEGGVVTLDLGALLLQLDERVGIGGRLAQRVPPGSAQVVILRSDQLKALQDGVDLLRSLAVVLPLLVAALYLAALAIASGSRRVTLVRIGIGLLVSQLLVLVTLRWAEGEVIDALVRTAAFEPAAHDIWDLVSAGLIDQARYVLVIGLLLAIAGWIAGPRKLATGLRRRVAPYLEHNPVWFFGGVALIPVLLLVFGPSPTGPRIITLIVLLALALAGVEVLRRQTREEFSEASEREPAGSAA